MQAPPPLKEAANGAALQCGEIETVHVLQDLGPVNAAADHHVFLVQSNESVLPSRPGRLALDVKPRPPQRLQVQSVTVVHCETIGDVTERK